MRLSRASLHCGLLSSVLGVLYGCGSADGEPTGSSEQAAEGFCDGTGEGVRGLVCNVGATPEGSLAVRFKGQWFALTEADGTWSVQNATNAAAAADAVPVDATRVFEESSDCPCTTRKECIQECGTARPPRTMVDRRTFRVRAGGRDYTVEAREVIFDDQVSPSCSDVLRMSRDLVFEVHRQEAGGEWTVLATPRRIANLGTPQAVLNESATEPNVSGETGAAGSLFAQGNVTYEPNVELSSAVRRGMQGVSEDSVSANPATQAAFDTVMLNDASFQRVLQGDDSSPGQPILRSDGTRLAASWPGGGALAVDLQRVTDVWLDTRRGESGWSERAEDRPSAVSGGKNIVIRRGSEVQKTFHFPFLAGICGFEANLFAFVRSEFRAGNRRCFDGAFVSEASGFVEAGAGLGAGFGCNLLVASASAGLEGVVGAMARFDSAVQSSPPALRASVALKTRVRLNAYFKTRVLFWTRKWTGTIAEKELFNRSYTYSMAPLGPNRALDLCDGASAPNGTCSDPASTCDLMDRCIRYELGPATNGEVRAQRVDTGPCNSLVGGSPSATCAPQAVKLGYKAAPYNGLTMCSGVLISPRHVLTAGHCLSRNRVATDFTIQPGVSLADGGFIADGKAIYLNPYYEVCAGGPSSFSPDAVPHDVGVLEFEGPPSNIVPATIDWSFPRVGDRTALVAYGLNDLGQKRAALYDVTNVGAGEWPTVSLRSVGDMAMTMPADSGGPFFRETGCIAATQRPTVTALVSADDDGSPTRTTYGPAVATNAAMIERAIHGERIPPAACCPGRSESCTRAGGGQGTRTCSRLGTWDACR